MAESLITRLRRGEGVDLVGKPFVLHYANGYGYWVAPVGDSRDALTEVVGTPEAALADFAALVSAIRDPGPEVSDGD